MLRRGVRHLLHQQLAKGFHTWSSLAESRAHAAGVLGRSVTHLLRRDAARAWGKWTHVAITFDRFNTGQPDGEARLYLDGRPQGTVSGRNQVYTWDPDQAVIFLGLGYAGLMDDLMVFDRPLSAEEVEQLAEIARDGSPLLGR